MQTPLVLASSLMILMTVTACGPNPAEKGTSGEPQTTSDGATPPASQSSGRPSVLDIDIPDPLNKHGGATPGPLNTAPVAPTDEAAMARAIMANPAAYKPETYVVVTKYLWERGDKKQAAFWHYLFQIRTLPWLEYDRQMGPFRSGVNASIGQAVTEWIGSDWDAFVDTTARAISYERRMPLSPERPAGVSEDQWRAAVARGRETWASDFRQMTGPGGPAEAQMDARRRQNGLYVGPLQNPGAALPADWR